MLIDTDIYGQLRPFRMDDPMEQASKVYAMRANQLGIQDAERKLQLDDDLSRAFAESGGDLTKASQLLAQRGRGQAALQLQDKAATQRKTQVEEKLKLWESAGSDAIALDQLFRQARASGADDATAISKVQPVWANVRQKYASMGFNLPEQFDPQTNFSYIGTAKENIQYLKTLQPNVHMTDTGGTVTPTNTNPMAGPVGPLAGTQPIAKTPAPAAPTELDRLLKERDALPADDPRRKEYDRVIASYKAGRATDVTIAQPGPMQLGKEGSNTVDKELLQSTGRIMRLNEIGAQFKPEFQTTATRLSNKWASIKEKAGIGLTNKEKVDLTEFASFKRNAVANLNQYIHDVTGAAMSEQEVPRIRAGVPDPGTGMFDGDSPTEFKAKFDDTMRQLKMAEARYAYIKRSGGVSITDASGKPIIPLERMPSIMNERGAAIEKELKAKSPSVSETQLRKAVRSQLAREFGLVE